MIMDSGFNVAICQIIVNKRKERGYTQTDMAEMLNTNRRTYQRWEEGNLTLDQLLRICNELKLSVLILPDELLKQ